MTDKPISPLRQRMIDDMTARRIKEKVQKDYVRHVRTFAAFLGRSPDTATSEDLRRFQVHLEFYPMMFAPGSGSHGCVDYAVEGVGISEGLMGQMARLEIVPDNLDVVEFGCVFWQPLDGEPVFARLDGFKSELADMDRPVSSTSTTGFIARPG